MTVKGVKIFITFYEPEITPLGVTQSRCINLIVPNKCGGVQISHFYNLIALLYAGCDDVYTSAIATEWNLKCLGDDDDGSE